jgi:hypothetical protein
MKRFILGPDGMPCIWPIPWDCTWNDQRYDMNGCLRILPDPEFRKEAESLVSLLKNTYSIDAVISGQDTGIRLIKGCADEICEEGYILKVTDHGAEVIASSGKGIFYGCQTLLQMIANSPDSSLPGVHMIDKPVKTFRAVKACLPKTEDIQWFQRFIDFMAKYKLNTIIMETTSSCLAKAAIEELVEYIGSRHINIISPPISKDTALEVSPNPYADVVSVDIEKADTGMGAGENKISAMLRASCLLWWEGCRPDKTAVGSLLPDTLEKVVAQLYPMERDRMNQSHPPSRTSREFKALDIRACYNAPLVRSYWRVDDYFMMHLKETKNLPNTVPFSLFQGVTDFKLQAAFAISGNTWNNGFYHIPVKERIRSLAFLHTYIIGKNSYIAGLESLQGASVGCYRIHYADGTEALSDIVYGRTIHFWKNYHGTNRGAYWANPVLSGITGPGMPYTIYSQEWINGLPDAVVESIDIIPAEGLDGGIAVFGITAVK